MENYKTTITMNNKEKYNLRITIEDIWNSLNNVDEDHKFIRFEDTSIIFIINNISTIEPYGD